MPLRSVPGLVLACALVAAAILAIAAPRPVHAQDDAPDIHTLTLEEALELAATAAPQAAVDRARIAQTAALRTEAALPLRDNPVLELEAGPRVPGNGDVGVVLGAGVSQTLELGGQRTARIDAAEAALAQAEAAADVEARQRQAEVGYAFLHALAARQRLAVAEQALALTAEIVAIETRKLEAGDASELERAVATLALTRSQAEAALVAAEHTRALAELRALLGLDPDAPLSLAGTLDDHLALPPLDTLLARAAERPEQQALAAEVTEAQALTSLADALAWPDLGVGLGYELEEGAHTVLASLAFTLPVFDAGQGTQATAIARADAARVEMAVLERTVTVRTEALLEVHLELLDALRDYETTALDLVEQTEAMARTAYEAGAVPLAELLTLRRELIAARTTHIDLLLAAALSAFELRVTAGDLP